jgi:hypothetical protein
MGLFDWLKPKPQPSPESTPAPSGAPAPKNIEIPMRQRPQEPQSTSSAKPATASVSTPEEMKGMTTIDRPEFLVQLPGVWSEVPSTEPNQLEFRCKWFPDQLIIAPLTLKQGADPHTAIKFIVEKRRAAIETTSKGKAVLSSVDYRSNGNQFEARYTGRDSDSGVQIATVVRANPLRAISFSIYRYTLEKSPLPFEVTTGFVFDLIQLR